MEQDDAQDDMSNLVTDKHIAILFGFASLRLGLSEVAHNVHSHSEPIGDDPILIPHL